MRVLVLSHQFPNDGEPESGIYVLEQARALRTLGVESVVMAPRPWVPPLLRHNSRWQKYVKIPHRAIVDNFEVIYPSVVTLPHNHLFAISGLLFYFSCRRQLRNILRTTQIDLIHAHTIMPDGFAAALLGREFNLPVVCTIHGSDVNLYPRRDHSTYRATRWALVNTDHLIAVSQRLKNKILSITGPRGVAVIHNGADTNKFNACDKRHARQVLGLPTDKKVLLFVGNLLEVKGVSFLLQALQRLARPELSLYVVGGGDLREGLENQAEQSHIPGCTFVGPQPHDRIPLWLSAAYCLVLPSLSEGLPTILCEAMQCKTPIVATAVGGIPEIINDHTTGLLVPSGDARALASAIAAQLDDSACSAAMTENAYEFARQNLTWQANAHKTLRVYEGAVELHSTVASSADAVHCTPLRL